MAETEENGVSRHSRTSSTTSSTSTDDGLVLSVAGLKSAGPKKDRPNSGNNNSGGGPNSLTISEIEVASLRAELEAVRGQLNAKDKEVAKLGRIRDELENEVQDLTASLFEEAHKMVGAANIRAAASERSFGEASMKIDGLETEVAALKDLVLTSTPSKPNRHLHPQISNKKSHPNSASTSQLFDLSASSSEDYKEERLVDPVVKKEYLTWKKSPNMAKDSDEFLQRLYKEDVLPCLSFPNSQLASKVLEAVEANTLCMSPIVNSLKEASSLPQNCALMESNLVCQYRVLLENVEEEFEISQLARNRIATTCECINYLRYICEGLVKAHHNEVYWEIVHRRRRMMLARLGLSPDDWD